MTFFDDASTLDFRSELILYDDRSMQTYIIDIIKGTKKIWMNQNALKGSKSPPLHRNISLDLLDMFATE